MIEREVNCVYDKGGYPQRLASSALTHGAFSLGARLARRIRQSGAIQTCKSTWDHPLYACRIFGYKFNMLDKAKVVAFAAVSDTARAKTFYGGVLGLPLVEESPFALVYDANGTMLRVTPVGTVTVAPYTVLGWDVGDIAATVRGLGKSGVKFERYPGLEQNELGIWNSPGGAQVAWFKDPDGNTLSVTEF